MRKINEMDLEAIYELCHLLREENASAYKSRKNLLANDVKNRYSRLIVSK